MNEEKNITLWQVLESGKRVVRSVKVIHLNLQKRFFVCRLNDLKTPYIPEFDKPFYVANVEDQDFCFKCELSGTKNGKIKLKIPITAQLVEHRQKPRLEVKYSSNKRCRVAVNAYLDLVNEEEYRIVDISRDGLGLVLNAGQLTRIKEGATVRLLDVDGVGNRKLEGLVKYIRKQKVKEKGSPVNLFRCGIKFDGEIKSFLFDSFN
ncbi:MAG: hypothetical protein BM556_14250 [Bacteriovorax sp. MedPE-SWde]|nr:MAG: hypothetical protein BM556_14250 [Bacteriovorax sp. MedPE-SWde]